VQGVLVYPAARNPAAPRVDDSRFSVGLAVATIRPVIGMFFATSRFSGLTPHEFSASPSGSALSCTSSAAEAWIRATLPQQQTVGARIT